MSLNLNIENNRKTYQPPVCSNHVNINIFDLDIFNIIYEYLYAWKFS